MPAAIVVGKTNTPEFGAGANTVNPVYGATGNPFDPEKTCAGSSGGSAVALATGMVPLATGSDTGGSLRNPAAYCGIVGFRPSPGVVPSELRLLGWSPLPVQGPMARNVADVALLFAAMSAIDPRDPLSHAPHPAEPRALEPVDLCSLRVAISEDLGFSPLDHGIRATFRAAVARFARRVRRGRAARSAAGRRRRGVRGHPCGQLPRRPCRQLSQPPRHARSQHRRQCRAGPRHEPRGRRARDAPEHTVLYRRFLDFMADYDVLICPAMSVPPFPHSELHPTQINGEPLRTYFHWLAPAYGLTLTGHPVVCLPCGLDHTGMPFGIQVCGRRFGDWRALGIAAALERSPPGDPGARPAAARSRRLAA